MSGDGWHRASGAGCPPGSSNLFEGTPILANNGPSLPLAAVGPPSVARRWQAEDSCGLYVPSAHGRAALTTTPTRAIPK